MAAQRASRARWEGAAPGGRAAARPAGVARSSGKAGRPGHHAGVTRQVRGRRCCGHRQRLGRKVRSAGRGQGLRPFTPLNCWQRRHQCQHPCPASGGRLGRGAPHEEGLQRLSARHRSRCSQKGQSRRSDRGTRCCQRWAYAPGLALERAQCGAQPGAVAGDFGAAGAVGVVKAGGDCRQGGGVW